MKRILLIGVSCLALAAFSGCGKTEPAKNSADGAVESESSSEIVIELHMDEDGQEQAESQPAWYGSWEIKDYQTADIYALSQEKIEEYLTYKLVYDQDSCSVNGQVMENGNFGYETESCTEESILKEYHVNLGEWWNGIEEVTGVHVTSSENFFGCNFYSVDENTLWVSYEGVFFLAKRAGTGTEASSNEKTGNNWDELVSNAIFSENQGKYTGEECRAEGHQILEMKESGNRVTVYALTMYGEYQFQDGNFVKEAGSGAIPTVLTFAADAKEEYSLESYKMPEDGSGYLESVHKLFPEHLWETCISPSDEIRDSLRKQERAYATEYLKSLGRQAAIGEYGDFADPLLTENGISVEVSNRLSENKAIAGYPFWIGSLERLELGVRYVYRMDLDQENRKIILTKTAADSGEAAETHVFDADSGDLLSNDTSRAVGESDENRSSFSFADISNLEFWFGSGAGAWRTVLNVREDGSFAGEYLDDDMGSKTRYLCNFSGRFTEPEKVDEYTWSVRIEHLEFENEPDTKEIRDRLTYIYREPYGLEDAEELLFYLPGKPVEELTEECLMWMHGYGDIIDTRLPFYGLYNVNAKSGFSSHEK